MREEDTVCVGSDGLRHCKVCGEAKEAFFPEGGFMGMNKHCRKCSCDIKYSCIMYGVRCNFLSVRADVFTLRFLFRIAVTAEILFVLLESLNHIQDIILLFF